MDFCVGWVSKPGTTAELELTRVLDPEATAELGPAPEPELEGVGMLSKAFVDLGMHGFKFAIKVAVFDDEGPECECEAGDGSESESVSSMTRVSPS